MGPVTDRVGGAAVVDDAVLRGGCAETPRDYTPWAELPASVSQATSQQHSMSS